MSSIVYFKPADDLLATAAELELAIQRKIAALRMATTDDVGLAAVVDATEQAAQSLAVFGSMIVKQLDSIDAAIFGKTQGAN